MNMNPQEREGPGSAEKRFVFVDALRGIAAVGVMLHHLRHVNPMEEALLQVLPAWFAATISFAKWGVEIFFVLSGFVIAHSLRNVDIVPSVIANFFLRRQLRLDPAYWTLITVTLLARQLERCVPWVARTSIPELPQTLANFFYLQHLTGSKEIVEFAWTLCLEVQFYVFFLFLLAAGKVLAGTKLREKDVSAVLVLLLAVGSILLPRDFLTAWFIQWWFYFAAGALCYWAVQHARYRILFLGFLALFCTKAVYETRSADPMVVGLVATSLLFVAGLTGGLTKWLNFPVLQYFGRTSYSLYLVHSLVGCGYVYRFGQRLTGQNPVAAGLWFCAAAAASILAAHLLHVFVERPSMLFASKLKPGGRKEELIRRVALT